jgi:hypothetical protein
MRKYFPKTGAHANCFVFKFGSSIFGRNITDVLAVSFRMNAITAMLYRNQKGFLKRMKKKSCSILFFPDMMIPGEE